MPDKRALTVEFEMTCWPTVVPYPYAIVGPHWKKAMVPGEFGSTVPCNIAEVLVIPSAGSVATVAAGGNDVVKLTSAP